MNAPNFLALINSVISENVATASEEQLVDFILGGVAAGADTAAAQTRLIALLEAKTSLTSTDIFLLGRVVGFLNEDALAILKSRASEESLNALTLVVNSINDSNFEALDVNVSTRATQESVNQLASVVAQLPTSTVSGFATETRLNQIAENKTLQDIIDAVNGIEFNVLSNEIERGNFSGAIAGNTSVDIALPTVVDRTKTSLRVDISASQTAVNYSFPTNNIIRITATTFQTVVVEAYWEIKPYA